MSTNFDTRSYRSVMGRFATGVCIATTEVDGQVHGATVNSFTSVSLDPPLVLISLDNRTRLLEQIRQTGRYSLSILTEDQVHLSNHFAGRPQEGLEVAFDWVDGHPLLSSAVGHIATELETEHLAGDHTLLIGRVTHLEAFDEEPLLFFSGRYATMAEQSQPAPIGVYSIIAMSQFLADDEVIF